MPAVSVCVPAYNYGRFLPDAIGSVLAQTWRDFELVVVDNCSSDDTAAVLERFARADARLRHVRNATVLPMSANFNRALRLAEAEYVKILCADDWLAPRALERSVAALAEHPGAALAATGRLIVSEAGRRLGERRYAARPALVDGRAAINRCLFGTNYIGEPSAVLFRRRLAARGFDEAYPHLVDLEMWFHLLEQGALVCLPEPLAMVRRHGAQLTRDNLRLGGIVADKTRLYGAYAGKPYVRRTPWNLLRWRLRLAWNRAHAWLAERRARPLP